MIAPGQSGLSRSRQCGLLGLARSSYYYAPVGESALNLELMRLLDEKYTRTPFFGEPRMTEWLIRQGYAINHKRVERLMRELGLAAIYPKPRLSAPGGNHRKYPYLLGDLTIARQNQVWCTDITYVRMSRSFLYLVAIMDWFSRYVLSWGLSSSLEGGFCQEALRGALGQYPTPEIFNSDQGSQFTAEDFAELLVQRGILVSMDGRGRVYDNIFIERLWRSVKYEEVYLRDYQDREEAESGLRKYFQFYNRERYHQALGYATPEEVYQGRRLPS
jgi:putative transposase